MIFSQKWLGKSASILMPETQGNIPTLILVTIPTWSPTIARIQRYRVHVLKSGEMRRSGPKNSTNMLAPVKNLITPGK